MVQHGIIIEVIKVLFYTEYWPSPSQFPQDYQAAIMSCDLSKFTGTEEDDPLMNPKNWRITPPLLFDWKWMPKSFPNLKQSYYRKISPRTMFNMIIICTIIWQLCVKNLGLKFPIVGRYAHATFNSIFHLNHIIQ
jgi:hypothetical protein